MVDKLFPPDKTLEVAQACVCLHTQRAARALARHFDEVFRPLSLTNGQFSLLMALNRREPPTIGQLAPFMASSASAIVEVVIVILLTRLVGRTSTISGSITVATPSQGATLTDLHHFLGHHPRPGTVREICGLGATSACSGVMRARVAQGRRW